MSDPMLEALKRFATGKKVTKNQLIELERDGLIIHLTDGTTELTWAGTALLADYRKDTK